MDVHFIRNNYIHTTTRIKLEYILINLINYNMKQDLKF